MRKLRMSVVTICWLGFALAPSSLSAHAGAMGLVKERMDAMGVMGQSLRTLSTALKGDLDWEAAQSAVDMLAQEGARIAVRFEENEKSSVSEASAEIWENWDMFLAQAESFSVATSELKQAVSDQDEALSLSMLAQVQRGCGSCHSAFRIKN